MAQASATAASSGVLVATKLHAPEPRPETVPRDALVARLLAGSGRKVTLVCAPAGWGKTTLLSEWRSSPDERRRFAWVSLDPGDDDPVRFWGYVLAALRTVQPTIGESALGALPGAGGALADAVIAPLINELGDVPEPIALVLDDYHLVHAESIHESMTFLVRHLPRTLHLVVATRADPPLPLGRLRASGELSEIRAAELRFTDSEAGQLLNGSLGLDLQIADIELLQERTEGWAAGLQLAALSLSGREDKHAFVEEFAGADRQIGDYLHEVLGEQPAHLREFLLRTSTLDRMCASLCDAVTGRHDAAEELEAAERANLFLIPLDPRRDWYRYHHLFRDLLRHELTRADPELIPELHRRASAWHRAAGNVDEAIAHATAAGDVTEAGDLIARHWRSACSIGQTETVARWIDTLPREAVLGDGRLCVARGWTALFLDRLGEVEPWLEAARVAPVLGALHDGSVSVGENAGLLESTYYHLLGDVGGSISAAREACDIDPAAASLTNATSFVMLGVALYFAGALDEAEVALETGRSRLSGEGWLGASAVALSSLTALHAETGDIERAERVARETEGVVTEFHLQDSPWSSMLHLGRGKLLDLKGDQAGAEAAYARSIALGRSRGRRLSLARALLELAGLKRRRGAYAEARSLAREARGVVETCPDPGMLADMLARTERALQLTPGERTRSGLAATPDLSEREIAVLRLLASRLSQREIGSELYVSFNTVKTHTRNIFAKLGVATRADAVARGRELGLL